jgi:hypothetical protein
MATMEAPAAETPKAAETPHVARIISSDSIPAGGFTPGTILADRYRIIGLLGRGGMGEVYRADDLKLGQPVALKFLPQKLAEDPVRRERFFAEVRITRQLSHPNICRVYDIGEIEGRHFLSMEFIDGEDLASLLKRIGHLTNEKALDIARQLAAGLAAAHERGVLHRDLKPANIMLDGHGRVRITDFGLAIVAEDETQSAEIAGTPAYMAPEQLAGKGATVRSDIYSLGLVLYEIYTGKKAFTATNLAELRQQKETHTPRAISELREGMDAVVERLIQRCMERDPNARPASVAQLALALPGGDPLAAALAAGETPSPEMVAASGSKEGLRPAVAWGLLVFIIAGTLGILAMSSRSMLHRRIPFEKSPEALVERTREFLKKVGYSEKPAYSAYGFVANADLLSYLESLDKTSNRWKSLNAKAILFWYRQSSHRLNKGTGVTVDDPSLQYSGDILIEMDTEGHLVAFHSLPLLNPPVMNAPAPDWTPFFVEADLNPSQWNPVDPQLRPASYVDYRAAWQGSLPNTPGVPDRVEATALQGKAASFEITGPWTGAVQIRSAPTRTQQMIGITVALVVVLAIIGGIFFARRNLKLGRGDRRNATRLAVLVMSLTALASLFTADQRPAINLLSFLWIGGLFWVLYIGIEPSVRRRWPQMLVSWTRFLSGEWRDPLVARDTLIGCASTVLFTCLFEFAWFIVPPWFGHAEAMSLLQPIESVAGIRFFSSALLSGIVASLIFYLIAICILMVLTAFLKNQKIAVAVCMLAIAWLLGSSASWMYGINFILSAIVVYLLMRYGFLAVTVGFFAGNILFSKFPITLDTSTWYAPYGVAALAIFAALVLYGFRYSLGGRPLLASSRLDE